MMRSGTDRRTGFTPPPEAKPAYTLPSDLFLEIVARTSDAATVLRCAAICKELRRGILSPGFVRRICHGPDALMPPSFLGYLRVHNDDERRASFSLVHPATPAAVAFSRRRLVPFLQTYRAGARARLLGKYTPVAASRNGLVALRRRCGDICVYDPMAGGGHRPAQHVPLPPGIEKPSRRARRGFSWTYVLLTAADAGVGCSSFLLFAAGFSTAAPDGITVQTVSSDDAAGGGAWGPVCNTRGSTARRTPGA